MQYEIEYINDIRKKIVVLYVNLSALLTLYYIYTDTTN